MVRHLALVLSLAIFSIPALGTEQSPQLLFEGYYKITMDSSHVGYMIQRYEFDSEKKEFKSTYFIRTNESAGNTAESLKALANEKFEPISYQYTWTSGGQNTRQIDAKFAGRNMTAQVRENIAGEIQEGQLSLELPERAFLSTFLGYLMLQSGLKKDLRLTYQTVIEETGGLAKGIARVLSEEELLGLKTFKVENRLTETGKTENLYESHITPKGFVLKNHSPAQKIHVTLMPSAHQATQGFQLPTSTLKTLFGSVPAGAKQPLAPQKEESQEP